MQAERTYGVNAIITNELARAVGEIAAKHPECAVQIQWPEGNDEREWVITATNGVTDWTYLADDEDGTWHRAGFDPADRDTPLLLALEEAAAGVYDFEWTEADRVARHLGREFSPQGVGQKLARLAREGRCRVKFNGYMNLYKPLYGWDDRPGQ